METSSALCAIPLLQFHKEHQIESNSFYRQVRTCTVEPDAEPRPDGTLGSYTLQAKAMKRVYELIDHVDLHSLQDLHQSPEVPDDPLVVADVNRAIGNENEFVPDVKLSRIPDSEVRLSFPSLSTARLISYVWPLYAIQKYKALIGGKCLWCFAGNPTSNRRRSVPGGKSRVQGQY